jgi:hypothetical protein
MGLIFNGIIQSVLKCDQFFDSFDPAILSNLNKVERENFKNHLPIHDLIVTRVGSLRLKVVKLKSI